MKRDLLTREIFPTLCIFLALVLIFIHRSWIFSISPLISGDWPYFYKEQLTEWFPFHSLWINYDGLGRGISQGNFIFLFSVYSLLAKVGLPFELLSRLLFFWPVIIGAPVSAFLALSEITKNRVASIVGTFVYVLNTYFVVIKGGHMHLSITYALAPLAYYFAIKKPGRSYFWLFTILAISSLYDVRTTLLIGLFTATMMLFYKVKSLKDFASFISKMAIGGLILALLNSFWILPMIFTLKGPFTKPIFNQSPLNWINIADALTLHHPFWSTHGVTDFIFNSPPIYMFILPFIAFLPFVIIRAKMKQEVWFFGCVALTSFFFLTQENSFFGPFYSLVYSKAPIFSMFRESSKFFFVTAFCFSVLIAFFIKELVNRDRKILLGLSALGLLCALTIPLTTYLKGDYTKTYRNSSISDEVKSINHVVFNNNEEPYKNLWISRVPKFAISSSRHPSVDALELGQRFWGDYSDKFDPLAYLKEGYFPALLNFSGTRYAIVPSDSIDTSFRHYRDMPASTYQGIVERSDLELLEEIGQSKIYENKNYKPHIYFSTNTIAVDSLGVFSGIDRDKTAAYIFKDQNKDRDKSELVSQITDNTELNIFQPGYIHISPEMAASNYEIPANERWDLYTRSTSIRNSFRMQDLESGHQNITEYSQFITGNNLYEDGSFEESTPVISDCNNYDKTDKKHNGISGESVPDATQGSMALKIMAGRHVGCFSKKIEDFDSTATYLVELDYKFLKGGAPFITFYPYKNEPLSRATFLPTNTKDTWSHYQTTIKPHEFSEEMYFIFYLPTIKGQRSETVVDNIRIFKLPYAPEAYIRTKHATKPEINTEIVKNSSTEHQILVENLRGPSLVVFSETYDPNWEAVVKNPDLKNSPGYTIPSSNHLVANAFANSWWVDTEDLPPEIRNETGSYEITLTYNPQKWFYIGSAVSGTTFASCIGYLGWDWKRNRRIHSRSHMREK